MNPIYVIIYGSKYCRDSDEIKGYVTSETEAKTIVKNLNAFNNKSSEEYSFEVVNPLKVDEKRHFMPAGFYVHNSEPKKKMRLVSFDGSQGNFQISKNSKAVMIIGLGAVTHVDPPADYMEWNKVFE